MKWTTIDPSWFVQNTIFFFQWSAYGISSWNVSEKVPWIVPDSKVHVTNMGPNWVLSAPGGPHVGHMDLAIRDHWLGSHSPHRDGATSAFLEAISLIHHNCSWSIHSIETSSTVDPQWNILHCGCKWNLHTVFWDAVGCEWGQPLFTLGWLMFALSYVDFLSLL